MRPLVWLFKKVSTLNDLRYLVYDISWMIHDMDKHMLKDIVVCHWQHSALWGAVCFKSTQFIASSRSSRRIVTLRFETHGTLWYAVRFKSDYSTLRHATPGATWTQFWNIRRHLKSIKWPAVSKLLLYHHFVRYEEPRPRSAGSFVTKSFETYSTQCHAVCLKICNSALRRQYTPI